MNTEFVKLAIEDYNDLIVNNEKYKILVNTIARAIKPCSYRDDKITLDDEAVFAVYKVIVPYVYEQKVKEFAPKEEAKKE